MPSPVGHTIAGLCGYTLVAGSIAPRHRLKLLLASVVIASLPDIDILPGVLAGDLGMFHRQGTHSLTTSLMFGLAVGSLAKRWKLPGFQWGLWTFMLYLSHILLDMFVESSRGVQFLWPFSASYFISPITIFKSFKYSASALGTIRVIFSFNNLLTVLWEIGLMLPLLWLTQIIANKSNRLTRFVQSQVKLLPRDSRSK